MSKKTYLYIICFLILSIEFDYSLIFDENTINIRQINLLILLFISFLPKLKREHLYITFSKPILFLFIAYIIFCGLSIIWSFNASETIGSWIGLIICFIVCYNIVVRYYYNDVLIIFTRTFTVTLFISWALYFTSLQGYTINKEELFRFKGIYSHAMRLALIIFIAFLTNFCGIKPYKKAYMNYLVLALFAITIFLTKSRTFITFTFLVSILIYIDNLKKYRTLYLSTFFIIALLSITFGFTDLLLGLYQRGDDDITELTGRTFVWINIIPLISSKLLFGHGYGSFKAHPIQFNSWIPEHAHNIWLHQAYETGVIGSLLFTATLIYAFLLAINFRRVQKFSFLKYFMIFIFMAGMTGVPVGANVSILYFIMLFSMHYESILIKSQKHSLGRESANQQFTTSAAQLITSKT